MQGRGGRSRSPGAGALTYRGPMPLTLRPLRLDDETEARRVHAQLAEEDFEFLFGAEQPWSEIVANAQRESAGADLPPGRVPADFLLAEVDGVIVGRSSIRHSLTPFLREVGGHVGYAVGPEHRRRGYATEILRQSLARLAALGVGRVLVTCDDDNIASARTIERCGGVLEDVRDVGEGTRKRRYWIDAA